jgi:hypothetical protein
MRQSYWPKGTHVRHFSPRRYNVSQIGQSQSPGCTTTNHKRLHQAFLTYLDDINSTSVEKDLIRELLNSTESGAQCGLPDTSTLMAPPLPELAPNTDWATIPPEHVSADLYFGIQGEAPTSQSIAGIVIPLLNDSPMSPLEGEQNISQSEVNKDHVKTTGSNTTERTVS